MHRQRAFGDVLEMRFGPRRGMPRDRVMLLGHWTRSGRWARSRPCPAVWAKAGCGDPGTLDMKAGVAMALTAIEMLTEAGLLDREVVLLLNSDEEVGSSGVAAHHGTAGAGVQCGLRAGAGAGAGLQDSAQGHRQLAHRDQGRRRACGRGFRKGRQRAARTGPGDRNGKRLDRPEARPDGQRRPGRQADRRPT